jgi:hypothetical protein
MKFQIQVRGSWGGTAGDWRPAIDAPGGNATAASTFGSWDEAEEVLDQMQLAGLLPCSYLDASDAELRIIDLDDRGRRAGMTVGAFEMAVGALEPDGADLHAGMTVGAFEVAVGAREPDGSDPHAGMAVGALEMAVGALEPDGSGQRAA